MVRLTATCGAVVMRMERDDAFITAMLSQFLNFYNTFVLRKEAPPPNFLDSSVEDTMVTLAESASAQATMLARLSSSHIQRARPSDAPLLV